MNLLGELRRRKVIRVAVVYVATAFAMLQAADIMLPRMGVPDWGMSLVIALLGMRTVLASALLVAVGIGLGAGWLLKPGDPLRRMRKQGAVGFWEAQGFPRGCRPVDDPAGRRLDCSGSAQ